MPAYYFAMEGYNAGEKHDPAADTLITIQYQKIDLTSGEPLGELTILKAWESSEQSIITMFYEHFFKPQMPVTHFIPVGMSLDYEYEMILSKFKKYNLPAITSHQLYYQRPRFDLKSVIVLLNDGRFTGARLDSFSPKKYDDSHMKKWYDNKEFKKIERYIREESEAFLKLLQYLNKYKTRLGITKKEDTGHQEPERPVSPLRVEQELPSRTRSPSPARKMTGKPAEPRTPSPSKSSARIAKADPPSPRKTSVRTKTEGQRTSLPLNQFRKHTPVNKKAGKRG